MESKESPILQGLNPAQRDAVVNYDSPSLIIAGAGSGKTRVLTSRIAYMIEQGIKPWNILALTFTNKAAESMRERIAQMLPDNRSRYIRMGTFHSVFSRILRENAEKIGFTDSFTIYEPSDCKNLLKTIVRELNLPRHAGRLSGQFDLRGRGPAGPDPRIRQHLQHLLPALQAQRRDGLR